MNSDKFRSNLKMGNEKRTLKVQPIDLISLWRHNRDSDYLVTVVTVKVTVTTETKW